MSDPIETRQGLAGRGSAGHGVARRGVAWYGGAGQGEGPAGVIPPVDILSDYCCLDLETGNAPEEVIHRAIAEWTPPANLRDPEKIIARREEAETRIRERAALLDASPIICIAAKTQAQIIIFSAMDTADHQIDGVTVLSLGTERDMLIAFRNWLDATTSADTVMAGHNLLGFDLPKIRGRIAWHKLRLPECLQPRMSEAERQPVSDTMRLMQSFSIEHRDGFASLEEMATGLGIPHHKGIADGSMIPALYAAGEYRTILSYCTLDCLTTEACWLRMMSEGNDLE